MPKPTKTTEIFAEDLSELDSFGSDSESQNQNFDIGSKDLP